MLIRREPRPGAQEVEESAKGVVLDPVGGTDARSILAFAAHAPGQLHLERLEDDGEIVAVGDDEGWELLLRLCSGEELVEETSRGDAAEARQGNTLVEMGVGFAFVGHQYHLEVAGEDFYIDVLFYHLRLHCYVVVELKAGEFRPEHAGKLNFYLSAVDDLVRDPAIDGPSIGLLLCKSKNRLMAEYALRDIHKPIGVANLELTRLLPEDLTSSLPTVEALESELGELPEPTPTEE